jgi:choline kinase
MAVVNLQSKKTRILPARTKRVTKPETNYQRIPVNPNQRVVIMAAGMCTRWKNYLGVPKQLAPVNGEAIINRTIRLLKERGITDIYVTVRTPNQYGDLGVKEYINFEQNQFNIDRLYGARELSPCVYLYGDCYYTERAMDIILSDTNDYRFFGRRKPGIIKSNREIYAIKANDFVVEKARELREMHAEHKVINSLGGHLLIHCLGIPVNPRTRDHTAKPDELTPIFTDIDDETTDIDMPHEYRKLKQLVERQPVLKTRPIKTYYDLARMNYDLIHEFLELIPPDIDLVIGIPRDGIMIAYLISIYRNIPMTDLTSFCEGIIYKPGIKHRVGKNEVKKILLVDDICASGKAMRDAKSQIEPHLNGYQLYCAALYTAHPQEKIRSGLVDFYGPELVGPRAYEWTHGDAVYLPNTYMDIDGVLCPDWNSGDDSSQDYVTWLKTVPLRLRPKDIGTLITWRREEHRSITMDWLAKNRITYRELIMCDRSKWKNAAEFKAHYYGKSDARLMIESSAKQAEIINKLTNKPTVCFGTNETWGL